MRILNKNIKINTKQIFLLFTTEEAKKIVEQLDILLSPESKTDHFQVNDTELKYKLIIVIPEHNNIEELQKCGLWIKPAPLYAKDVD